MPWFFKTDMLVQELKRKRNTAWSSHRPTFYLSERGKKKQKLE
jgi:hypothetical protein